ncbi:layilin [Genypterus blacodes]|uniref:layilin n=1 Tax=Genypterus blacodes TaxID=154954 RepID=UPI003F7692C7
MANMDLLPILCHLLLLGFDPSTATSLITAEMFEARGQRVCRTGRGRPCYKLAFFSDSRRRLNFAEAELACRRDGGQLLSVESLSEQKLVEKLITDLQPTDGDFWIGLRRNHGDENSSADCSPLYYWLDGSEATFRNWHWDEPSCGYEVCVVMYHQPTVPPGLGGPYMFQWNDDKCETRNNFICKYTAEKLAAPSSSPNSNQSDASTASVLPVNPRGRDDRDRNTALNLVYVIIPTIPLILLLLTVTGVCCYKMFATRSRKQQKSEVCQTDPSICPSPRPADVYNVIRLQKDDDLLSTRPQTKNTSFLCSSPDTPTGDYDNLGGRDTESGFVTLASTESCFLNFDLNDLSLGRRGTRDFYDTSLGRPAKRDVNDGSLGRSGHRELYDRSLGRRTTKSEHYGNGLYGDHSIFDASLRAGVDPFEPKPRPAAGQVAKADLYQTYITGNGKDDAYQSTLGSYANRKSYQPHVDSYRNELSQDGGRRYFNEHDWINRQNY